jgi:predicted secreted protein
VKPLSFVAVYLLFWVISAFVVMPFGVKTADEAGIEKVAGQADSAPAHFRPGRILLWTTILATAIYAVFYLNYLYNWVTIDTLSFYTPPKN